jgi:protocatechuate 3,4-dioxygenase alpha subunit
MSFAETPSQTIGPFFACMLEWPDGPYAVPDGTAGGFWLRGAVYDGAGAPVPDALVETWQSRENVFGRCRTDAEGRYGIFTVRPSRFDGHASHITMSVFARGLLDRVVTRVYFADDPDGNAADPVLAAVDDDAARATLLAQPDDGGYRFDIHLQGDNETVFFLV